ncbi:hypothetical protein Tco_1574023, partial [Tanacetum coccineum]
LGRYPTNVRIFPDPILFMAGLKLSWEHGQQRPAIIVGGKAARIKDRKYKTRGGSSKPPMKHKLVQGSSSTRATRAKSASLKDNSLFLTISDDDEGLLDVLELQDANACHLKFSAITPPTWKGYLDNQLDLELLDLHDRCYARQAVADNAVNQRARELLKVSLSTLESKVASLEAEKVRLEASEVSLSKELENAKLDRAEVLASIY